jgi:fucose permease
MALMRFAGDGIRNRYGAVTTMRVSSLIAAAGILAGGLAPWASLAILAFGIAGLGVANMVPIAFSAAGNQPGLSPGAGMSVVTTMGYSGILLAPSGIGFVAQQVGLAPVFIALSLLLLVVCALSPLVASADFRPAQAPAE